MLDEYPNIFQGERLLEVCFVVESLKKIAEENPAGFSILDVGGVPSEYIQNVPIYKLLDAVKADYQIADFRPNGTPDNIGFSMNLPVKYVGDFVQMDIPETFDVIIFLSSLEHFPQCTEGDRVFREGEDRKGFEKALSLLNPAGKIILTVPFGRPQFIDYQQNYDLDLIYTLTEGTKILKLHSYGLIEDLSPGEDVWVQDSPENLGELDPYGVCCLLLEKEG